MPKGISDFVLDITDSLSEVCDTIDDAATKIQDQSTKQLDEIRKDLRLVNSRLQGLGCMVLIITAIIVFVFLFGMTFDFSGN